MRTALMTGIAALAVAAAAAPALAMPNPASAYCYKVGGTLEIVKGEKGEVGMCKLPGGVTVEEWALYREAHPSEKRQ